MLIMVGQPPRWISSTEPQRQQEPNWMHKQAHTIKRKQKQTQVHLQKRQEADIHKQELQYPAKHVSPSHVRGRSAPVEFVSPVSLSSISKLKFSLERQPSRRRYWWSCRSLLATAWVLALLLGHCWALEAGKRGNIHNRKYPTNKQASRTDRKIDEAGPNASNDYRNTTHSRETLGINENTQSIFNQYNLPPEFDYDDFKEMIRYANNYTDIDHINLLDHLMDPSLANMIKKYLIKEWDDVMNKTTEYEEPVHEQSPVELKQDTSRSVQYVQAVKIPAHKRSEFTGRHRAKEQVNAGQSNLMELLNHKLPHHPKTHDLHGKQTPTNNNVYLKENGNEGSFVPVIRVGNRRVKLQKRASNEMKIDQKKKDNFHREGIEKVQPIMRLKSNNFSNNFRPSNHDHNNHDQVVNNKNQILHGTAMKTPIKTGEINNRDQYATKEELNEMLQNNVDLHVIDSTTLGAHDESKNIIEVRPLQPSSFSHQQIGLLRGDLSTITSTETQVTKEIQALKARETDLIKLRQEDKVIQALQAREIEPIKLGQEDKVIQELQKRETELIKLRQEDKVIQALQARKTQHIKLRQEDKVMQALQARETHPIKLRQEDKVIQALQARETEPIKLKQAEKINAVATSELIGNDSEQNLNPTSFSNSNTHPRRSILLQDYPINRLNKMLRKNVAPTSRLIPVNSISADERIVKNDETPPLSKVTLVRGDLVHRAYMDQDKLPIPNTELKSRQSKSLEFREKEDYEIDNRPIFQDPRTHPDEIMYYNALEDEIRRSKFLTESVRLVSSDSFRDLIVASRNKTMTMQPTKKTVKPFRRTATAAVPKYNPVQFIGSNEIPLTRETHKYQIPTKQRPEKVYPLESYEMRPIHKKNTASLENLKYINTPNLSPKPPRSFSGDLIDKMYNFKNFESPNIKFASQENRLNDLNKYLHLDDQVLPVTILNTEQRIKVSDISNSLPSFNHRYVDKLTKPTGQYSVKNPHFTEDTDYTDSLDSEDWINYLPGLHLNKYQRNFPESISEPMKPSERIENFSPGRPGKGRHEFSPVLTEGIRIDQDGALGNFKSISNTEVSALRRDTIHRNNLMRKLEHDSMNNLQHEPQFESDFFTDDRQNSHDSLNRFTSQPTFPSTRSKTDITTYRPVSSTESTRVQSRIDLPSELTDYSSIFKNNLHNFNWAERGSNRRKDYNFNDDIIYGNQPTMAFTVKSHFQSSNDPSVITGTPMGFNTPPNLDSSSRTDGATITSSPDDVNHRLKEEMKRLREEMRLLKEERKKEELRQEQQPSSFIVPTISRSDWAATPSLLDAFYPPSSSSPPAYGSQLRPRLTGHQKKSLKLSELPHGKRGTQSHAHFSGHQQQNSLQVLEQPSGNRGTQSRPHILGHQQHNSFQLAEQPHGNRGTQSRPHFSSQKQHNSLQFTEQLHGSRATQSRPYFSGHQPQNFAQLTEQPHVSHGTQLRPHILGHQQQNSLQLTEQPHVSHGTQIRPHILGHQQQNSLQLTEQPHGTHGTQSRPHFSGHQQQKTSLLTAQPLGTHVAEEHYPKHGYNIEKYFEGFTDFNFLKRKL